MYRWLIAQVNVWEDCSLCCYFIVRNCLKKHGNYLNDDSTWNFFFFTSAFQYYSHRIALQSRTNRLQYTKIIFLMLWFQTETSWNPRRATNWGRVLFLCVGYEIFIQKILDFFDGKKIKLFVCYFHGLRQCFRNFYITRRTKSHKNFRDIPIFFFVKTLLSEFHTKFY